MKKILICVFVFMLLFSLSFSADEIYDTVSGEIEKKSEFYIPEESEKTAENFGETLTKENASSFFDIKKLFSFFIKSVLSVFDEEKGMFLYGGSTVVVLLRENAAELDEEFFTATEEGFEIPVVQGQRIGYSKKTVTA